MKACMKVTTNSFFWKGNTYIADIEYFYSYIDLALLKEFIMIGHLKIKSHVCQTWSPGGFHLR